MTKVWITRTQPAADKTAEAIRRLGFDPIIVPLLRITPPDTMPPITPKTAVLVFTSSNGVRAFCDLTDKRSWPVVTVGDATANVARDMGFTNVQSASGTSETVTELIKTKFNDEAPIIHCSGDIVRGTITADLEAAGYTAQRDIFYKTETIGHLPELKDVHYVVLHSPLAAKILRALAPNCAHMSAVCMSPAVSAALGTLPLREKRVANAPTETALLTCLPC